MPLRPRAQTFDNLTLRHGERYKWLVLLVVGLGTLAGVLSTTSFSVAVPALSRHFGIGQDQVQWAITGFMAAMTVAMLPTPWLLDRVGFRRLFLIAILVLGLSSIAGSFATSFQAVVAIRVLQGMAAGFLQPLGTLAVMRLFPAASQGRASGALGFGIVLGPAIAPAIGGFLLDHFGWRAIFLINLPFCLLAGVLGLYLLPLPRQQQRRRFDWTGLTILSFATLALVEAIASLQHSGPAAGRTWIVFTLAGLAILLFVRHGQRTEAPIIGLGHFRQRTFSLGTAVSFSYGFGLYASTYLIPVFLQNALGYSAGSAGMALLPSGIALALVIPLAGRLADRHAPKWVTAGGLALFAISFLLFAALGGSISYAELIAATVIGRLGLGLILPALSLATLRHLEPHQLGESSTVISYARQVGGVLGIAIAAVFVEWRESVHGTQPPGVFLAYSESFLLLTAVFVAALAAACLMQPPRPSVATPAAA